MSTDEDTIMSEAEQTERLDRYMAETKKALKTCSKNDLIRAVSALLIDKQLLVQEIKTLRALNSPTGQKVSNDVQTT